LSDATVKKRLKRDLKIARQVFNAIENEFPTVKRIMAPHVLFAMCLIYARQLQHHETEERELKHR
jgi:hypothetical protein